MSDITAMPPTTYHYTAGGRAIPASCPPPHRECRPLAYSYTPDGRAIPASTPMAASRAA